MKNRESKFKRTPQKDKLRESQQPRILGGRGVAPLLSPTQSPDSRETADGAGNNACFVMGSELPSFCGRLSPQSLTFCFSKGSKLPKMSAKRIGTAENSSPQLQVFQSLFALARLCHSFLLFQKCEMGWLLVFVLWSLLTLPSV